MRQPGSGPAAAQVGQPKESPIRPLIGRTSASSVEPAKNSARRVPPPLRFGAALVYVLIHHKPAGRDVGLAKSGFRPTALHHSNPSLAASERIT
jgi:hypothetical protein